MPRLLSVLPLLLLLALPPTAAATDRCGTRGKTVDVNRLVRLYTVRVTDPYERRVLRACVRATGRRVAVTQSLGDPSAFEDWERFRYVRLNGRFVAFEWERHSEPWKDYDGDHLLGIVVFDVLKPLQREFPGNSDGDLVVTASGAVAWVERTPAGSALKAVDRRGPRTLDEGNVAPGSLKLRGSVVSWRTDGTPRSATLR